MVFIKSKKERAPSPSSTRASPSTEARSVERSEAESKFKPHDESSSNETPAKKLALTGEHRTPFSERMSAMRQRASRGPDERQKKASLEETINAMTESLKAIERRTLRIPASTPAPPPTPSYLGVPETCPGAPVKKKKTFDVRRFSRGSAIDSDSDEDYLFDRWANKTEHVLRKKKSTDWANERRRDGITTPDTPSPLRCSFNADQADKITAQLEAIARKLDEEINDPEGYRKSGGRSGSRN
ncbi:hypothetical protein M434DRAFT_392141 [Hypoxylon sp. CO27-5]|nr:hypothetical protein M434DRAFT_392141 [Hypoxylon sp. CO27-5]